MWREAGEKTQKIKFNIGVVVNREKPGTVVVNRGNQEDMGGKGHIKSIYV